MLESGNHVIIIVASDWSLTVTVAYRGRRRGGGRRRAV